MQPAHFRRKRRNRNKVFLNNWHQKFVFDFHFIFILLLFLDHRIRMWKWPICSRRSQWWIVDCSKKLNVQRNAMPNAVWAVANDQDYQSTKAVVYSKTKKCHAMRCRAVYQVSTHAHHRLNWTRYNFVFMFFSLFLDSANRILLSISESRYTNVFRCERSGQQILLQYGGATMWSVHNQLCARRKWVRTYSRMSDELHGTHRIWTGTARGPRIAMKTPNRVTMVLNVNKNT